MLFVILTLFHLFSIQEWPPIKYRYLMFQMNGTAVGVALWPGVAQILGAATQVLRGAAQTDEHVFQRGFLLWPNLILYLSIVKPLIKLLLGVIVWFYLNYLISLKQINRSTFCDSK